MKNFESSLLVEKLRTAGLTLSAHGGKLKVGPAGLLTDGLRQSIRENRAEIIRILAATPESYPSTTPAASVRPEPRKQPQRVTCGECARFLPGQPLPGQSLGTCSLTGAGPPDGGSGYKACYPMAPRACPSYEQKDTET